MTTFADIEGPDLNVRVMAAAMDAQLSDDLLKRLLEDLSWQQHQITMFGKTNLVPRLSAWHGEPEAIYTYSRIRLEPEPWTTELLTARSMVERLAAASFNSVLVNRYRDGADSMGWHADDERELGNEPIIASLSLGSKRKFQMRRKDNHKLKVCIELGHGDLFVMAGRTQTFWTHQIPKTAAAVGERLNLTFRTVQPSS